jgi:hypothetical protein
VFIATIIVNHKPENTKSKRERNVIFLFYHSTFIVTFITWQSNDPSNIYIFFVTLVRKGLKI